MNFSLPSASIQAASAAFENAANNIPTALSNANSDIYSAGSTLSDSVSLSTAVASLLKKNLDSTANLTESLVNNAASASTSQSSFSVLG
jgi:hypothetical protein